MLRFGMVHITNILGHMVEKVFKDSKQQHLPALEDRELPRRYVVVLPIL